jgi:hypothetical protein
VKKWGFSQGECPIILNIYLSDPVICRFTPTLCNFSQVGSKVVPECCQNPWKSTALEYTNTLIELKSALSNILDNIERRITPYVLHEEPAGTAIPETSSS